MEWFACSDRDTYQRLLDQQFFHDRWLFEQGLAARIRRWRPLHYPGYCLVCKATVKYRVDLRGAVRHPDGTLSVSWRNQQACSSCRLIARHRLVIQLLDARLKTLAAPVRIWMMEQRSRLFRACESRFANASVVGSEYLGEAVRSGATRQGIRHEDATKTSFRDGEFDLVSSNDVLEHVPDLSSALRELARVLRPGGELLMTVPFHDYLDRCRTRAIRSPDGLRHLEPAEYHVDPLDRRGALVYTDLGWDLLDRLREVGFRDARVVVYWSYEFGHLGVRSSYLSAVRQ